MPAMKNKKEKKGRNTTNVSCIGDRDFVAKLRILADAHDVTISEIVRSAIDAKYGAQLATINLDGIYRAISGKTTTQWEAELPKEKAS